MNEYVKSNLAKNVRKFREKVGISQEALSLELGFDVSYIGKVENRKMNISLNRLIAIADFFSVDFKTLFKD